MRKVVLFILVAVFIGCSRKSDTPEPENNILVGTKWQTWDFAAAVIWGGNRYKVIHFRNKTEFEIYKTKNGQIDSYELEGTYSLADKILTLKNIDKDKKEVVSTYTLINSGTLECSWGADYYCTYTKQ